MPCWDGNKWCRRKGGWKEVRSKRGEEFGEEGKGGVKEYKQWSEGVEWDGRSGEVWEGRVGYWKQGSI